MKDQIEYEEKLAYHIEELEIAQRKSENPAIFELAFNNFKMFAVQYSHKIDIDFDQKTRKQVEDVFIIENSVEFRVYKFISDNTDNFFRFAYIASFLLFLCLRLSDLFSLTWLYAVSIALFIASFIFYFYIIIRGKMHDQEWSFSITVKHYLKFECIFPRKQLKFLRKDQEEVKKKEQEELKKKEQ